MIRLLLTVEGPATWALEREDVRDLLAQRIGYTIREVLGQVLNTAAPPNYQATLELAEDVNVYTVYKAGD